MGFNWRPEVFRRTTCETSNNKSTAGRLFVLINPSVPTDTELNLLAKQHAYKVWPYPGDFNLYKSVSMFPQIAALLLALKAMPDVVETLDGYTITRGTIQPDNNLLEILRRSLKETYK
jgi:hypothetical protein